MHDPFDPALFTFSLLSSAEEASSPSDLDAVVATAALGLGAQVCVGLYARPGPEHPFVHVIFGQAPAAWKLHYCEAGHLPADPLIAHALRSFTPATWDDVASEGRSQATEAALSIARDLGLRDSLMVPQNHGADWVTAILFSGPDLDLQDRRRRHAMSAIATALQRAGDRLGLRGRRSGGTGASLSRREVETLYRVAGGLSDKQIAHLLRLSPETVTGYVRSASRKLGVTKRSAAVQRARDFGLLPPWLPNPPRAREHSPSRRPTG